MGFSRQEYWSGLLCPPPGDLPNPGIERGSLALQANSLPAEIPRSSIYILHLLYPFICSWTLRLIPCPGYCKQCCNEHWGSCVSFNSGFLVVYAQQWDCWVIWQFNNLRYTNDTTLMAESEEELKSLDESETGERKSWHKAQYS